MYKEHKDRARRLDSARAAIRAVLPLALYPAHKRELLSVCLWKITEADGKYEGVRYWSEGATKEQYRKNLRHEHVNTRKALIARLLAGEDVGAVMADTVACIVTKEEHKQLSKSAAAGWQRYQEAGIRVFDYKELKWLRE